MDKNHIFKLEELNDEFWKKVIFIQVEDSSGMGGAGCIWLITDEKKKYFISFDAFPYSEYKLEEFHPIFATECNEKVKGRYKTYVAERGDWCFSKKGKALVKKEYFSEFEKFYEVVWEQNVGKIHYVHSPDVMRLVLGIEEEMERYDEENAVKVYLERQEIIARYEEESKKNELTLEHFVWKPVYINNIYAEVFPEQGWYCLILNDTDKGVSGYKLTILYQRKEISPLCMSGFDAPIEKYILFSKYYDDIQGKLDYRNPKGNHDSMTESVLTQDTGNTFCDCDINDYGKFIRVFDSLEEAKEYAVAVVNIRKYSDKKRIIVQNMKDDEQREYRNLYRKYTAIIKFKELYPEILKLISEFEFPDESSGGGGYILPVLTEKLGLNEEIIKEMWNYVPMILLPRVQRKAKKIIEECETKLEA